ncbi:MAG: hypothetical protein QOJ20_2188 [Mycobacterium sp.]|jgi:hypothetical protein|nr:hypothetical protein [Mycobacterium sp.]
MGSRPLGYGVDHSAHRIAKTNGAEAFPHLNPHGRRREIAHNARETAHNTLSAHGLRDTLAELGVDELIPELCETEFEDDGTYHGSFMIGDQLVSYTAGELIVGE